MSQMSTVPVFKCMYCGRNVRVPELRTIRPDPEAELLNQFMRNLDKIAHICPECRKKRQYYASQGRVEEFDRGMAVPIDLDSIVQRMIKLHDKTNR